MDKHSIYYAGLRDKNRALLRKRETECYEKEPLLLSLTAQRSALFSLPIKQAKERMGELSRQKTELLEKMGLPADYLEPIYSCPLCRDTGYTGSDIKKKCVCLLQREQQDIMESGKINSRESFENFSLELYPDEKQRARAQLLKGFCEEYANKLPDLNKPQLLFFGMSGLGKSYLGNAIAKRLLERGIHCRRITAYHLIQEVMDGLQERSSPLSAYIRLPFLVLDDLGTEPLIPNITKETLFALVDERRSASLPTLYITNLDYNELQQRYGERTSSRILDEKVTTMIHFQGSCLRRGQ